ncbi:MAG: hypothetical protein RLZZ46_1409 [Bacteroidota bacterium]|jgi:hypothetical protein
MIVYNVTCTVEPDIAAEWINWMKECHIPEVMASGMFISWELMRVVSENVSEHTYAIQYRCSSFEKLADYRKTFAPQLMKKTLDKYGQKVLAFRTVLEKLA